MKEATEGFFVYFQTHRRQADHLVSSVLHKHWKERYFFVSGRNWEYNPTGQEDTLDIPTIWTALENLRELPFTLIGFSLRKS